MSTPERHSATQDVTTVIPIILSSVGGEGSGSSKPTKIRQDGKRWVRRRDNSRFVGNVHVVKPSTKDYDLSLSPPRATFPKPLPPFLPRHIPAPSASLPLRDPVSANAGRYSLSLKGVRRELRRSGPRTEQIVLDIEKEMTDWLRLGGILLFPDSQKPLTPSGVTGEPLGFSSSILEIRRSPMELIWRVDEEFPRFLVHCVARFHGVVSLSKTTPGAEGDIRLTHLLRPNVTRPDFLAPGALDTPPASDLDAFSATTDTEGSDATSEAGLAAGSGDLTSSPHQLSHTLPDRTCDEGAHPMDGDDFTLLDEREPSMGEGRDDSILLLSMESLTLGAESRDWEQTPRRRGVRAVSYRSFSPSRSLRRTPQHAQVLAESQLKFWHYVFA